MKQKVLTLLKFLFFISLGLFFLWLAYRKTNPEELKDILMNDVNYWWIGLGIIISFISHLARALRWKQLIETIGSKPSSLNVLFAVFIGYFANLAIPRMGEISRCGVLSKYENVNFSKTVGTVVTERVIDMLFMLMVMFITIALQLETFQRLIDSSNIIINSPSSLVLVVLLIVGTLAASYFWLQKSFPQNKLILKIQEFTQNLWMGMKSVKMVKKKGLFSFYSLLIWVCYFLMTYVCFFAFDSTTHLNAAQGLLIFIMGSIGMILPVQGGIGPWHKFTIMTLVFLGIQETQSAAFAFVVHAAFTALIILGGFFSIIVLPFYNAHKKSSSSVEDK